MSGPIDIVRSIHNAFRRDIFQVDGSVVKIARAGEDPTPIFDRLHTTAEILDYHAKGEEAAVFPAVDNVAPLVARAYFMDHRELDTMVSGLEAMRRTPDPLTTARATAVLASHLRIHLDKEDVHLYPILRERTTDEEQMLIGKTMSSKIPPQRFPATVNWLFPLINFDDQITVTKGWMAMMPPPVFAMAKQLIKKNPSVNWVRLTQQVSGLTE